MLKQFLLESNEITLLLDDAKFFLVSCLNIADVYLSKAKVCFFHQ